MSPRLIRERFKMLASNIPRMREGLSPFSDTDSRFLGIVEGGSPKVEISNGSFKYTYKARAYLAFLRPFISLSRYISCLAYQCLLTWYIQICPDVLTA